MVVFEWTYEFHGDGLFSELSRLLHARERRNENRKAVGAPPFPFKGHDAVSTSTVTPTASEPNATPITQPTTAVTSSHQGQTVSSVQAPTQDFDRPNPRCGFQYGYQSNNTPTHNYWEPLSSQISYDMDKRYDSGLRGHSYGQCGSWYANTEYARTPQSSGKGCAKPQMDWAYGRSTEYGKPRHCEIRPSYGSQYGSQHSEGSGKGKGKDGQNTYKGGKGKGKGDGKGKGKGKSERKAKAREMAKAMREAKGKDMAMPRATQKERAKVHMLQPTFACLWARSASLQRPNTLGTAYGMSGMMKSTMSGTMTVKMHTMYIPVRQNVIHMILMHGSTIHENLPHAMGNISPTLP